MTQTITLLQNFEIQGAFYEVKLQMDSTQDLGLIDWKETIAKLHQTIPQLIQNLHTPETLEFNKTQIKLPDNSQPIPAMLKGSVKELFKTLPRNHPTLAGRTINEQATPPIQPQAKPIIKMERKPQAENSVCNTVPNSLSERIDHLQQDLQARHRENAPLLNHYNQMAKASKKSDLPPDTRQFFRSQKEIFTKQILPQSDLDFKRAKTRFDQMKIYAESYKTMLEEEQKHLLSHLHDLEQLAKDAIAIDLYQSIINATAFDEISPQAHFLIKEATEAIDLCPQAAEKPFLEKFKDFARTRIQTIEHEINNTIELIQNKLN